jgi:hypothetical protein
VVECVCASGLAGVYGPVVADGNLAGELESRGMAGRADRRSKRSQLSGAAGGGNQNRTAVRRRSFCGFVRATVRHGFASAKEGAESEIAWGGLSGVGGADGEFGGNWEVTRGGNQGR